MADGAAAPGPGSGHATALQWLRRRGWNLLPAPEQAALRGGTHGMLLAPRLAEVLQSRRFHYKGQRHRLSAAGIAQAVHQVAAPGLAQGLLPANEQLYNQVAGGVTVTELMPDGKRHQPTIALIDWHDPAANCWDVAELPALLSAQGLHVCTPGLVCFVNGIPLVVIETGATLDEAIARHLRNQRQHEIPQLYAHAQLLVALSAPQARYGTTGTPAAQWARWCDEELTDAQGAEMAGGADVTEVAEGPRQPQPPSEMDHLLEALLQPERLLEFLRVFVLFDAQAGKVVARPAQFFATRALLARIRTCPPEGPRQGGMVGLAPGSGRSFAMAFLAKAVLLHAQLPACRVVVVADRPELEERLARNCRGSGSFGPAQPPPGGADQARAGTGRGVAQRIGRGSERLVFTTPRRFDRALRLADCRNPGADLVVLADQGWWRQGGPAHANAHALLRRALPHAACVAYSGTPMPQGEMAASPFGPVVRAYPMQQALADGVVQPPRDPAGAKAAALPRPDAGEPPAGRAVQQVCEPAGVYQVPSTAMPDWLGILRSAAGEAAFGAVAGEQWAEEARRVHGVVQDAVQEHSLNPRDIEAALHQALLPRLYALMGLERAKHAIGQVVQAAGVDPPRRRAQAVTGRR